MLHLMNAIWKSSDAFLMLGHCMTFCKPTEEGATHLCLCVLQHSVALLNLNVTRGCGFCFIEISEILDWKV